MVIGERIKKERKRKGLSQQQLGDLLGISKVSICRYEKGTRTPTMETFLDLIRILDVTPDYILGRDVLVVAEGEEPYKISMAKTDIEIIKEFKNHHELYNKLSANPKRVIELIDRKIK